MILPFLSRPDRLAQDPLRRRCPASGGRERGGQGSVLIDGLLAASLFGLILVGVTRFSLSELERAEINAVAIDLSGWLDVVARSSMRLTTAGCVVTFTEAPDGVAPNDVIARVHPTQAGLAPEICNPEPSFRMPGVRHGSGDGPSEWHVSTRFSGDGGNTVSFTPRGTVTNQSNFNLVIRHIGNSRAARCIRVNAISGLIEIGHDDSGSQPQCPEESFSDLI
jgi:hypothetical protein